MPFKRLIGILEGRHIVGITNAEVSNYKDGNEAINLTVKTRENVLGKFLIFTNNTYLVDKLIEITYDECLDDEINEKDFIGVSMEITTKEKNGYMNIVDINPVEFEEDEVIEEEF